MPSRNHSLFELNSIKSHNVPAARFPLQPNHSIKVSAHDFIFHKILNSFDHLIVISPCHINDIHDEFSSQFFKFVLTDLILALFELLRDVLKDQYFLHETFLFQKISDISWALDGIHDKEFQAFGQTYFDGDVIFLVDWFHQLIQLTEVAFASLLQLVKNVHELCILCPDLLLHFHFFQLKLLLKQSRFRALDLFLGSFVAFFCFFIVFLYLSEFLLFLFHLLR